MVALPIERPRNRDAEIPTIITEAFQHLLVNASEEMLDTLIEMGRDLEKDD